MSSVRCHGKWKRDDQISVKIRLFNNPPVPVMMDKRVFTVFDIETQTLLRLSILNRLVYPIIK